jgi:hypothetical protein
MSTRLEDDVRAALRAGTEHLCVAPDPYARVMDAVDAHRRRRRTVIAGSATAVLALAGVVGLAGGLLEGEPRTSTPASEQQPDLATRWGLPFSWPARGELGTEPGFADAFTRAYGGDHHLLYAEDGDAGRVAIAVSSAQEAVVFHGPRGADLDDLARVTGRFAETRHVAVAVPQDGGHRIIVLLPGNFGDAEFSTPESVARDGSLRRRWQQMPVEGGVGHAFTSDPLATLRVASAAGDGPPTVAVGDADRPPGTLICDRCDEAWFETEGLAEFHAQASTVVGADAQDVRVRLSVNVAIPPLSHTQEPGQGSPGRVFGYVATLPSGGLLRATYAAMTSPGGPTVAMVEPLRPLPAGDDDRPIFIPPRIVGPGLIIAPGSGRVTFSPLRGAAPLADTALTDGVGVIASSPADLVDYTITVHGSDGGVTGTWHGRLMQSDDPFARRPKL